MLLAHYIMKGLFLKENWLGKSFLYKDADDKLKVKGEEKLIKIGMEDRIKKRVIDETDYNAFAEEILGAKVEGVDINALTYNFIKSEEVILQKSPCKEEENG